MSKPQHEMRKAVSYWITSSGWSWAKRAATYMRQANCEVLMSASKRLDELEIKNADLEAERDFLLSALGRVQEMTKDSHPVAYGIAEHAIECTRQDGDYDELDAAFDAAIAAEREACAKVCDAEADRMEQGAQEAIENGEHDEVSAIRSTAWRLSVAANRIRARPNTN